MAGDVVVQSSEESNLAGLTEALVTKGQGVTEVTIDPEERDREDAACRRA